MQTEILPSRIAASVTHAPVQKSELLVKTYKEWGARFPTAGKNVADVRANIDYAAKELGQWTSTMDVRARDMSGPSLMDGSLRLSLDYALGCMSRSVTENNKSAINNTLDKILALMRPWVGAIIQDDLECSDCRMAGTKSQWTAFKAVLDLDLSVPWSLDWNAMFPTDLEGRDFRIAIMQSLWHTPLLMDLYKNETRWPKYAQEQLAWAERHLEWHSYQARIDRLAYSLRHPVKSLLHKAALDPDASLYKPSKAVFRGLVRRTLYGTWMYGMDML